MVRCSQPSGEELSILTHSARVIALLMCNCIVVSARYRECIGIVKAGAVDAALQLSNCSAWRLSILKLVAHLSVEVQAH